MTIEMQSVSEALASGRWLGLKEILRALSLPPGQQSALKRVLARMLKEGAVEKDGKQFRMKQSQSQSPQQRGTMMGSTTMKAGGYVLSRA